MPRIRTFIAIEISAEVRDKAAKLVKHLQQVDAKVSWTKPENLHLTLKFLGDTRDTELPALCRAVETATASLAPFPVSFRQVGAFPRNPQPRTIWIGVDRGEQQIKDLQRGLENALYDEGFQRERRKFVPHLTVGRVREGGPRQVALGEQLMQYSNYEGGDVIVEEVLVMASDLTPEGPVYQVVGRGKLDG